MDFFLWEFNAAFLAGHGSDEDWPVVFREVLHAAEACPAADVANVLRSLVLVWRRPAHDDVGDAGQPVLVAVSPEQAESCPKAEIKACKLAEGGPLPLS